MLSRAREKAADSGEEDAGSAEDRSGSNYNLYEGGNSDGLQPERNDSRGGYSTPDTHISCNTKSTKGRKGRLESQAALWEGRCIVTREKCAIESCHVLANRNTKDRTVSITIDSIGKVRLDLT